MSHCYGILFIEYVFENQYLPHYYGQISPYCVMLGPHTLMIKYAQNDAAAANDNNDNNNDDNNNDIDINNTDNDNDKKNDNKNNDAADDDNSDNNNDDNKDT